MRKALKLAMSLAIALGLTSVAFAAQDKAKAPAGQDKAKAPAAASKWTGTISDAMCGKSHGDKGGTMQKDHDCAVKCAKNGSYVFVSGDKIYKIADQKSKDLETHAGHKIEVEGSMKGDTITISKITMMK